MDLALAGRAHAARRVNRRPVVSNLRATPDHSAALRATRHLARSPAACRKSREGAQRSRRRWLGARGVEMVLVELDNRRSNVFGTVLTAGDARAGPAGAVRSSQPRPAGPFDAQGEQPIGPWPTPTIVGAPSTRRHALSSCLPGRLFGRATSLRLLGATARSATWS